MTALRLSAMTHRAMNRCRRHSVSCGNTASRLSKRSRRSHLGVISSPYRRPAHRRAALLISVTLVVADGSKKQMRGIYARPNIASVAHMQPAQNRPVRQFPCESMGAEIAAVPPNLSVSSDAFHCRPQPATRGLFEHP